MAKVKGILLVCLFGVELAKSQYVGSKACYGCHTEIYKSYQKSAMGRSMTPAGDWKPDRLPAEATLAQPGTTRTFTVSNNEKGWEQSESDPGQFSVEHPLAYAVGSGVNGLTFLVQRGSFLFQAPLSFYSRTGKWDFSPGYEHLDLGFGRMAPQECINCHAGRAAVVKEQSGEYATPPFQELAIGCENCHGPGDAHIKSLGKARNTIVNPAKLTPRLAEDICLNCHQGGDARVLQPGKTYQDFRPGQWLFDTAVIVKEPSRSKEQQQADLLEHHSAMRASRCFRASAGKLSCLTCHDPHVQPAAVEAPAYYRAKCLSCHTDQSCHLSIKVRAAQNPPDNCTGCHMPKRDTTQISHSALTNHRIPASEGEPIMPVAETEVDGLVVVNPPGSRSAALGKITLLRAYEGLAPKNSDYLRRYLGLLDDLSKTQPDDAYVQAALGHRAFSEDRNEDAINHLKLALSLGNPAILLELAQASAKLGQNAEAIEYLKRGSAIDPYNAVMQKTLILQYINSKSYVEARTLIEDYVTKFPEDPLMRSILARIAK